MSIEGSTGDDLCRGGEEGIRFLGSLVLVCSSGSRLETEEGRLSDSVRRIEGGEKGREEGEDRMLGFAGPKK